MYEIHLTHGSTALNVISLRLTASCGDRLTIGAVSAAMLEGRLAGVYDLTGEGVTLSVSQSGVNTALGTYTVTVCQSSEDRTTFTAYDAALTALDGAYIPSVSAPPATALAVLADIATQCGLTLASTAGLTDQSVTPVSGCTCREMAGYMAALLGCNAVIDRSGKLALRWFADHGRSITPDSYYAGGLHLDGEQTLAGLRMVKKSTVTTTDSDGITTQTETTTTYSAGSGTGTVLEVDNPFATQAITTAVWTAVSGLGTFRTGSCSLFGGLSLEPGDLLTITDTDNQSCVFPVMSAVLELDGGCKATVSGAAEPETALSVGVRGPVGRLLSRIEADLASFKELTADNFTAAVAKVNNLYADSAWVQNLFAQHIEAESLDIRGDSVFRGTLDAGIGTIAGIEFGGVNPDATLSALLRGITNSSGDWSDSIGFRGNPDYAGLRLVALKIDASAGGYADITISGGTGTYSVHFDSIYGEYLMKIPNYDGVPTADIDAYFRVSGNIGIPRPSVPMRVLLTAYYGVDGSFDAPGNVSVGNLTVSGAIKEAGTPLASKYAAINHDHDSTYLPFTGGTVDGDVDVTGDLTVTGEVSGSNIPIIQQGNTGPISGVSSTKSNVTVTFDSAFPGAPKVFLTPIQNGGYMPTVKLETVSSSGFRLAITIPSGSTNSISVDWMAIYV